MKMISVKQLRQNFVEVKEAVEEGENFILLYRSKPIAQIKPYKSSNIEVKSEKKERIRRNLKKLRKHAGSISIKSNFSPQKINKLIEESYNEETSKMLS